MTVHERGGARRRSDTIQQWSAQESAAIRELGRKSRDAWRAEKAERTEATNGPAAPDARTAQPERKLATNADFAAGIARAEFGRFYWNAPRERPLKAAMARRSKRDRKPPP